MNENVTERNAAIIRRHVEWFERDGATATSLAARADCLRRFAAALPVPLLDATPNHLDTWQRDLGKRRHGRRTGGLSVNTIGTYTAHVRRFYAWCVEQQLLDVDPAARLPRVRRPQGQAHPVPEKDLVLALAIAPEPIRTWLMLAAFMGLRCMEIAQLHRDSVDEIDGRLVISGVGKGRKPFRLIVPTHVEPSLRLWLNGSGPLWTTPRGYRLSAPVVSEMVNRWFRKQGMRYTMHWVRHSFGTAVYAQTKDLLLTQDLMRHSSPTTTRIYVETSSKAATKAADRLAARVLRERSRSTSGRADRPPGGDVAAAA